jgi:hypothetical protein
MNVFARSWMASLGFSRTQLKPEDTETAVLVHPVPYEKILDEVGDDPDVGLRRRSKEDCRSYRLRLQIFCQEEVIRREKYERFLSLLLSTERD